MRTTNARSIIAGSCALLALVAVTACNSGDGRQEENANAWSWDGEIQPPGTIHIRNLNGKIEVRPSSDNKVHITASTRWRSGNPSKDISFQVNSAGGDVTVCAIWKRGKCAAEGTKNQSTFNVFGSRSDVSVKFTVLVPTGVKVNLLTVNGSLDALVTAPVYARSANGNIRIGTSVGPVDAETANGDVDARMTTIGGEGSLRAVTVNGNASLYVPGDVSAQVELSNINGNVGTDFALGDNSSRHNISGTLGAGGRQITVATVHGNAFLRRLNSDGTVGGGAVPEPVTTAGAAPAAAAAARKP